MQNGQFPPSRKQSGAREAGSAREAGGARGGEREGAGWGARDERRDLHRGRARRTSRPAPTKPDSDGGGDHTNGAGRIQKRDHQLPRPLRRRGAYRPRGDKAAGEKPADTKTYMYSTDSLATRTRGARCASGIRYAHEDEAEDDEPADPATRSISSSHHQIKPRRTNQPASKPGYLPAPARCHLGLNSARVNTTASESAPTRPAQLSRSRSRPRGDREDPAQQKQPRHQRRSGDHRHQRRDRLPSHTRRPNVSLSLSLSLSLSSVATRGQGTLSPG